MTSPRYTVESTISLDIGEVVREVSNLESASRLFGRPLEPRARPVDHRRGDVQGSSGPDLQR